VDAWQWTPDLIWFDNLRSFGTPNYYVQKLFANNVGTKILPLTINKSAANAQNGLYVSASLDDRTNEVIIKAVNVAKTARPVQIALEGVSGMKEGQSTVLASADLKAENSMDHPTQVAPTESKITGNRSTIQANLKPYSLTVLRLPHLR
jgi:alpha-N-arabinofuranosidase